MPKKLIAYFSASGVTKVLAQRLAQITGADLFEMKPAIPYTSADLDWTNPQSRSSIEMKNPDSRPQLAEKIEHLEVYDIVYLGFPIWWGVAPAIVNTFMESYDFSGKTIVPFATSGGSGFGRSAEALKPLCSKTAHWVPGKLMNHVSDQELKRFVTNL